MYYNNNVPITKNIIFCLIMVIILMWMGSVGCRVADALERSWIRKQAAIKKSGDLAGTSEDQMEAQVSEQGGEDGGGG